MEIVLRRPNPGDIGWVISKHGEIYSHEFDLGEPFELDITKKIISFYEKSDKFHQLYVADLNGERVGSIAVSTQSEGIGFINFLLVLPEFRGRGIAQKLLSHVIIFSSQEGFKALRLETYSCLKSARRLYEKNGFKTLNIRSDFNKYGQKFDQEFWELNLHNQGSDSIIF